MPTYLYECENCGRFEEFQKITAEPLKECPHCGAKVKRIIGQPGIIFKGSGFYSTDNNRKNTIKTADNKNSAGAEQKEVKEKKADTNSKSEEKVS